MFMPIMPDDKIGAAVLAGNFDAMGKFDSKTSGEGEISDKDEKESNSASNDKSLRK
jgi:hypothetical protein